MVRMFFICVEQPCMMSLPNEEAKIEQLIRQLATISPPFVNSREELKKLSASIYLLADQLVVETSEAESQETIVELPPLRIPESRPIFADHSNPVPAVSEESIEEELQWQPAPTPPPPAAETPMAPPAPVVNPVTELRQPEPEWQQEPPVSNEPPVALVPESKTETTATDLFAQPETVPAPEELAIAAPETAVPPVRIESPATTPEPIVHREEPATPPAPVLETRPEPVPPPPVAAPPVAAPPASVDRDLQRALPLVRRLEFINRLFNGNDGEWQLFCQDVNRCTATSDALQIYRESYIRYGWEKHAEMADLLKQLIVKTFG